MEPPAHEVLIDGNVFKATSASELVVVRWVVVERDRFTTYHDYENDKEDRKSWYLDRKCELTPISSSPKEHRQRPRGTWTLTATVKGVGLPVLLYTFTLSWPTSWAAKGYTSFTFGFESVSQAQKWHGFLQQGLDFVKQRSLQRKHHRSTSNVPAFESGGSTGSPAMTLPGTENSQHQLQTIPTMQLSPSPSTMPDHSRALDDTVSVADDALKYKDLDGSGEEHGEAGPGSDTESEEDPQTRARMAARRRAARTAFSGRWVPFKQTNGVAIYYHDSGEDESGMRLGGEYMVSAVVRGPPGEVLDVLMNGSANTTILGPATRVEVLKELHKEDEHTSKEILRLVLDAPGWAGAMCAPRELVVERLVKTDEGELYVVLFSSLPDKSGASCYTSEPVMPGEAERVKLQESQRRVSSRRLFKKPVLGRVRGGYTISPLENFKLDSSPESLITCIVKVDLGGACSQRSWFKPLCDAFGWTDAFLDRILMSVILVRDEVEQSRFVMNPLAMLAPAGPSEEAERAADALAEHVKGGAAGSAPKKQGAAGTAGAAGASAKEPGPLMIGSGNSAVMMPGTGHSVTAQPGLSRMFSSLRTNSALGPMSSPSTRREPSLLPAVPLDLERIKDLCTLDRKYWDEIHQPGKDAPFVVRGPTYLKDKKKVPAGQVHFTFAAMDVVTLPSPVQHVARFLPSIRDGGIPWGIVINLIIPGTPLLGIVATFITDVHPDQALKNPPKHPMEEEHDWQPFDFVLHRFLKGDAATRNLMLKLIPHIAEGGWAIRQSVGTTPVILGKALKTTYFETPQYIEIDIDISANNVASYVTGMVRGATKGLTIDMGFVLEGTAPWELPEGLLGAIRLRKLDIALAKPLDVTRELPLRPALVQGSARGTDTVPEADEDDAVSAHSQEAAADGPKDKNA